jgi:hypothetical protein
VFKKEPIKELLIPCFINNYNYYIKGINLANQFRELYKTYRATLRNWWPLFYWLIDVAYINTYKLYLLHLGSTHLLTYLQFWIELYYKLFEYSSKAKPYSLRVKLGRKRVFNSDLSHIHYWEKRSKSVYVWCSYKARCQKVLEKAGSKSNKVNRVYEGYGFYNVNLCKKCQGNARPICPAKLTCSAKPICPARLIYLTKLTYPAKLICFIKLIYLIKQFVLLN